MKPWTNIKPGLINVARFALDRLGDDFEFNPSDRPGAGCCWPMPIKWRWTGATCRACSRGGGKTG